MIKTGFLAASALVLSMAFTSASAVTFEQYAKWDNKTQVKFQAWLVNNMEKQALAKKDYDMLTCIQTKFDEGRPELTAFQGELLGHAMRGTAEMSANKVGSVSIYDACKSKSPAPDVAIR